MTLLDLADVTTCINDLFQTQLDTGISSYKIRYKLVCFKKLSLQVDIIEFVFWVCCKLVIITTVHADNYTDGSFFDKTSHK